VHRDSEPGLLYYSVKTINLQPGTARILPSLIFSLLIFGLAVFMQANMLLHADCNVSFVSAAFYSILPPNDMQSISNSFPFYTNCADQVKLFGDGDSLSLVRVHAYEFTRFRFLKRTTDKFGPKKCQFQISNSHLGKSVLH